MRHLFFIIFLFIFLSPIVAQADNSQKDSPDDNMVIKTVEGISFKVPKDRPIEKKDGIVAPIRIDEYIAMKFSKFEERLKKIEDSIKQIEADLASIKEEKKD